MHALDAVGSTRAEPVVGATAYLLVDPKPLTRQLLAAGLLEGLGEVRIHATSSWDEAVAHVAGDDRCAAAIINIGAARVTDHDMAERIEILRRTAPDVPIILLSDHDSVDQIVSALQAGIRGYLTTDMEIVVTIEAIRLVCAGGSFIPASSLQAVAAGEPLGFRGASHGQGDATDVFTRRQREVLECLRRGMANKVIAHELNMRESTVKVHVRHIMKKLGATNRTQAVYLMEQAGQRWEERRSWSIGLPSKDAATAMPGR